MTVVVAKRLAVAVVLTGLASGLARADAQTDAIAERIAPVGKVCMAGQNCPTAAATSAAASTTTGASTAAAAVTSGPRDAETIYNRSCFACHNGTLAQSPKLGDVAAWEPRIAKGIEVLYHSAVNGLPPLMPPKGTCMDCSEEELQATVDYMVEQSR